MNAVDRALIEQLMAQATPAERALHRIVTIFCNAAARAGTRELRYYEIALEGLGIPPAQIRAAVEVAIQAKRDRIEAKRAERGIAP